MAQPLTQPLPPNLELWGDCRIIVAAIDPATGGVITGVNIFETTLEVELTSGSEADLDTGPFLLVTGPGG